MVTTTGPLRSVRVLDLSRLLPGPFCSLILRELGAEVLKIEDCGMGDYLRLFPPQRAGVGGAFYAVNRGKRSLALNLKRPEGRDILLRLLPGYQIVLESFRPGVLDRLGLSFDELRAVNPDVILCSITGYGQDGPLSQRAGHDINYTALSGALAMGGEAGGAPALPGVQIADFSGGLWAAVQILAALHDGGGVHLDVSMTEGALAFLLPYLGEMAFGSEPPRRGERPLSGGAACYGPYATSDGRHLAVGALEPKFFTALSTALGLSKEASAITPTAPAEQQAALRAEMQQAFAGATRDEWARRLEPADACVEPMLEVDELADHPQHRHRGVFYSLDDPERGAVEQLRIPGGTDPAATPAPRQGEHTDEVLAELGLDPEAIAALRHAGVVR
jgi:crotonobetainyl-CoA:carnitine CoA-transferase CaiB-like acyl-CoA transferase